MLLLPIPRAFVLDFLPKGGRAAEIGVARGDFSQAILERVQPAELHLIDPWVHQDRPDYQGDSNNVSETQQAARYEDVLTRFAPEIARGQVHVHRAMSAQAAAHFPENYFDLVYVDGLHAYEGVKADLRNYQARLKPGGFLMGHDYANHPAAMAQDFGVIAAVNEFVLETGWHFLALTLESYPTYILAKSVDAEPARTLALKFIYNLPNLVELRAYPGPHAFQQRLLRFDTDKAAQVFSF